MSAINTKVVAITGAGSGMGEADALLFAERGAKVILADLREDRLEGLAARIKHTGGDVAWLRTDVRTRDDLTGLVNLTQTSRRSHPIARRIASNERRRAWE